MRVELRSKLLDAAEYDQPSKRLKLYFSSGQIREFNDVPAFVVDDLKVAASPGSYYMKLIRNTYKAAP